MARRHTSAGSDMTSGTLGALLEVCASTWLSTGSEGAERGAGLGAGAGGDGARGCTACDTSWAMAGITSGGESGSADGMLDGGIWWEAGFLIYVSGLFEPRKGIASREPWLLNTTIWRSCFYRTIIQ